MILYWKDVLTLHLITKNEWLLTKYTARRLFEQFDGTEDELIEYVASRDIEQNTFSKIKIKGQDTYAVISRVSIGEYALYPNANGIYATDGRLI